MAKSGLPPVFVNIVLLEVSFIHLFTNYLWLFYILMIRLGSRKKYYRIADSKIFIICAT